MLSIGEFSKICSVTTKTLRYYDRIGLLKPVHIADSGYRYYGLEQLPDMLLINRLKRYGFALEEIMEMMAAQSADILQKYLREQQERAKQQIIEQESLIEKMRTDLENLERGKPIMDFMNQYEVQLIDREDKNVLYLRQRMSVEEYGTYIGKLFEKVHRDKLTVMGYVTCIYHDTEFDPENCDMELAVPVKEVVTGTRDMKGGLHLSIVHKGAYSDLGGAHARLVQWAQENGYKQTGQPFEEYLSGPNETGTDETVTQVYLPVRKV